MGEVEIPIFKERRMSGKNSNGIDSGYYISNSFAGILRLSPNNSVTLLGINNSLELTDETKKYINFSDSLITSTEPLESLLDTQFIPVTTSDGVLLDMAISNDAIEYNNLYIRGKLRASNAVIYINDNSKFKLGTVNMPIHYDSNLESKESENDYKAPTDIDNTYIVVNMAADGEPSDFKFKSVKDVIGQIIKNKLATPPALPTGSIHWIPVTLDTHKGLVDKGNKHNSTNSDPLIRDFLLCDGAVYNNSDFPELAKILYKEKITYWKPDGNNMVKRESINDYKSSKTFRVPDLRSMFIQPIIPLLNNINDENNKTGVYELDSNINPKIIINEKMDKHYHYIVLDNPIDKNHNTPNWDENHKIIFQSATLNGTDGWGLPIRNKNGGKPLAKHGSTRGIVPITVDEEDRSGTIYGEIDGIEYYKNSINTTKGCDTRPCNWFNNIVNAEDGKKYEQRFPSYLIAPLLFGGSDNESSYCHAAGPTCGYILSGSSLYNNDLYEKGAGLTLDNYVGLSSWNIDLTNESNSSSNENKENAPEYYACLPLIKI